MVQYSGLIRRLRSSLAPQSGAEHQDPLSAQTREEVRYEVRFQSVPALKEKRSLSKREKGDFGSSSGQSDRMFLVLQLLVSHIHITVWHLTNIISQWSVSGE